MESAEINALEDCDEPVIFVPDIIDTHDIDAQDCETVCHMCNAEFLDPEDLQQHFDSVHAESSNLIQCHFCTQSYSDLETYALHIRDYHLRLLKICTFCTKIFMDYDQHRKHERRHYCAKKGFSSCSQCSETFLSNGDLERHEFEHHDNDEDGFMLQDLFPIISSVLNVKFVDFLQCLNSRQPCECGACGLITSDIKTYIRHLQKKNCRTLACHNCSYVHKGKKNIFRHICRHNECFNALNHTKYRCTECQELIPSRFYKGHIKYCKPIKCLPCNIVFSSIEQLSSHQCKNHPLAVEVKLCKFCSRQCVGPYALKKHMIRAHKHEVYQYKYKCVTCDTPFKHPQKLFAHYFIKHKNLEPYTCNICDKKFRIRKRFTIHIKLDHKSVGFVEFDENYHVFFTQVKSDNPFVPHCVIPEEELRTYTETPAVPKKRKIFKTEKLDLELLNQTETEANLTEVEAEPKKKTLKRKTRTNKSSKDEPVESSDEDMPLLALKKPKPKKVQPPWARKQKSVKDNRQQLTCKTCNKYCYTFQNYQHHLSLHRKNDVKTCIKCSRVFKSKEKLNRHIEIEHSSSKLTETLKSLIEKRKKGAPASSTVMSISQRFQKTIRKSKTELVINPTIAKIKPLDTVLSAKKFLETFTPEADTARTPNVLIQDCVSIKKVADPFFRKSCIQMTRFKPLERIDNPKLTLPTRFKASESDHVKCTITIVENDTQNEYHTETYNDISEIDRDESIPDVAQEVMLEVSEEPPKQIQVPNNIILPNLPKDCEEISIAHLQSEAPYFKIVKVNQMLEQPQVDETKKELISLPDGTKMITVNPLAHLLGDKNVEDILHPLRNKYYKPKMSTNVENLLTKALEKANTPTKARKRKAVTKKAEKVQSVA